MNELSPSKEELWAAIILDSLSPSLDGEAMDELSSPLYPDWEAMSGDSPACEGFLYDSNESFVNETKMEESPLFR